MVGILAGFALAGAFGGGYFNGSQKKNKGFFGFFGFWLVFFGDLLGEWCFLLWLFGFFFFCAGLLFWGCLSPDLPFCLFWANLPLG